MRIQWNPSFDEQLIEQLGTDDLERRAQAIADACNNNSSWGGYIAAPAPTARPLRSGPLTVATMRPGTSGSSGS